MNQRQLNMIQSAQDGIKLARSELSGPGAHKRMMEVLQENFFEDETRSMSLGRACYLACMLIAWQDAGSPPLDV